MVAVPGVPTSLTATLEGGSMYLNGIKSEHGKFNPSSRTFCDKCSARDNLKYAFAYGRDIFLCPRHYEDWFVAKDKDPEIIRKIPGRDHHGSLDLEKSIQKQDRAVW
jgi:hypothetical protein